MLGLLTSEIKDKWAGKKVPSQAPYSELSAFCDSE